MGLPDINALKKLLPNASTAQKPPGTCKRFVSISISCIGAKDPKRSLACELLFQSAREQRSMRSMWKNKKDSAATFEHFQSLKKSQKSLSNPQRIEFYDCQQLIWHRSLGLLKDFMAGLLNSDGWAILLGLCLNLWTTSSSSKSVIPVTPTAKPFHLPVSSDITFVTPLTSKKTKPHDSTPWKSWKISSLGRKHRLPVKTLFGFRPFRAGAFSGTPESLWFAVWMLFVVGDLC